MKIAIDIDETVLEFLGGFFSFYKKHHNPHFNYSPNKVYNYLFEDILGVDSEEVRKLFTEFKHTPFFKNLPAVDGAKEAILELSQKNDIIFITARPIDLGAETKSQLKSLFPKNNFQIIHTHDNNNRKIKEKAEFCKELGIRIMIEDDARAALKCTEEGMICFLIDKPWNKKQEEHEKIIRVKSWPEIVQRLK